MKRIAWAGVGMLALLALVALAAPELMHPAHWAHLADLGGLTLATVPLLASPEKSRIANEFRAQADALRAKVMDPAQIMTKGELETALEGVRTFEARAAAVADFTPRAEIDRQGGDAEVRALNPDGNGASDETLSYRAQFDSIGKDVAKYFGGPNTYLLRLAQRAGRAYEFTGPQAKVHDRLVKLASRAIVGTANDASGGEFLLPLQQAASIFAIDPTMPGMLDIATMYPVAGRTLRIPVAVQTDATDTRPMAGIANVDIIGEGDEKPERTPTFIQRLLTIYKIAAYTEIGDETLADDFTGDLAPVVQRMIGGQVKNRLNEYLTYDGTGVAMPLGAFNANNGALLTVNRTTSQAVVVADLFNMYAKFTFGYGGKSAWFINRTVMPQIFALTLGSNTLVTWLPNLSGAPTPTLLGLPIIWTDLASVLGVKGDVALANGAFYAAAIRQALTVESSIHYKFRNDLTSYRFITRGGGIPIPTGTYAYKSTGVTKLAEHSPFVVLGDDVTS